MSSNPSRGETFTASVGIIAISVHLHKALCKNFPTTFCSENAICFSAAYLTRFHHGSKINTIYTGTRVYMFADERADWREND